MKLKLFFSLAFILFMNTLNAQIMYSDEEIKNKYDQETIILQQNGTEKNGVLRRSNPFFPSSELGEDMAKNGGIEANKTYKAYKKTLGIYWIVTILGIVGLSLSYNALLMSTATALTSTALLWLVFLFAFSIVVAFLGIKAYRLLARAIWQYNRNVLLKK